MAWAKTRPKDPYKLTKDECAAINVYTRDTQLYSSLNAVLLDADRSIAKAFFLYIKVFINGLRKIPKYKLKGGKYLYRGISVNVTKQYRKFYNSKLTFPWWTFTSTSKQEAVARKFAKGKGTMFKIKCDKGR